MAKQGAHSLKPDLQHYILERKCSYFDEERRFVKWWAGGMSTRIRLCKNMVVAIKPVKNSLFEVAPESEHYLLHTNAMPDP
jgi:hypothetical protein